jgi:branched-subunit amino acid aminotransferase/4-amino-4-deoxychorismate lyase
MIVYLNDAWLDARAASISIEDRGFLLADGVFETARLVNGKYFRLHEHLDRLAESARQLRLSAPPHETLHTIAQELAHRNALTEGSLRITLTRGPGDHALATGTAGPPTLLATLKPMPADWRVRAAQGWHLITATARRPSPLAVPSQLKTLGRVYALLAQLEAEGASADGALLLTADGDVAEGPTWNFFWRTGRVIRTADPAGGVLEGVTRGIILALAARANYQIEEGLWPPSALASADEAFATMTSVGVIPIRSLDGRAFSADSCATLLQRQYWEYVATAVESTGPVAFGPDDAGPD